MQRSLVIDVLRALAIVLMMVFHFIYDLNFLGILPSSIPDGLYWAQFRWLIISLFFICVGASLRLRYAAEFSYQHWLIGLIKIVLCALLISVGSYIVVPENWIFFGVLHFIAFAYIAALPFIKHPKISLLTGCILVVIGASGLLHNRWPWHLIFDGLPRYTNDFVQIFPWFGVVLIGIYLGSCKSFTQYNAQHILASNLVSKARLLSRNSLVIYLLHQPILFGLLYGYLLLDG